MQVSNLLYTLGDFFAGTSKRAKKQFYNGRVPYAVQKGEVYINTDVPYNLYKTIPQLSIPIDKLAAMFSNGVFMIEDIKTGVRDVLPTELETLLSKPNVLQSQNAFMSQYAKQYLVYGNQYIKRNKPSVLSKYPSALMNISPAYMNPVLTGKVFDQVTMDGIIKHYEYKENGTTKVFKTDEILYSKIGDLDNPIIGMSPLLALEFPLSNTELAYKYLNCISGSRGHLGILSYENGNKDSMGLLPQTPEQVLEIERLRKEHAGVEENQAQTMITSASVKYTPTSYPTGQMLLLEQIDTNFLTILAKYGVSHYIFTASTYDNLKHGLIQTHNDTIIPFADMTTQAWTPFIGLEKGKRLVLDYSHLPYLQTDKKQEAETFSVVSNGLNTLVTGQIITAQQANTMLVNQFGISSK